MAVPILMAPEPGNRRFNVFGMNGQNKDSFSTIPVPSGIVFDGGSDFDGPRAWEPTFYYDFAFVHELAEQGSIFDDTSTIRHGF